MKGALKRTTKNPNIDANASDNDRDREFLKAKESHRRIEIEGFASNLEVARIIFRRHPRLVKAKVFPEPYRAAIIESCNYDPNEDNADIDDLHITDPQAAERDNEKFAREFMAEYRAPGSKTSESKPKSEIKGDSSAKPSSDTQPSPISFTQQERKEQTDFLAGATLDERAYCIRLLRLLRDNYWMAELIRQILDKEARSRYQWTIKGLTALLENFGGIEALASNAQRLGCDWSNHPILRAIRAEWGDEEIQDYKGELRVKALIESAHSK
jgi:hypothetical protein